MSPGPDARLRLVQAMATGMDLVLGRVVVVGGPHVPHEAHLVDLPGQVRPPVGHRDAALTVPGMPDLHREDLGIHVPDIDLLGRHAAEPFPVKRRIQGIGQRRLGVGLARIAGQHRFGIERLHLAVTAREKHPDNGLGPWCEVRLTAGRTLTADNPVGGQHRAHRQAGESHATVGQEVATFHSQVPLLSHPGGGHRIVTKSL